MTALLNGNLTITIVDTKDLVSNTAYCLVNLNGYFLGETFATKTPKKSETSSMWWNESHTFKLNGTKADTKLKACVYDNGLWKHEIGRAVQQECRDRSRMPSSA
eukprot:TRINITY_DN22500_c0_g1_i3.p1 TRINITY_DN22500_c0_g1~~TRINITY_DN22500_c0_g1_i3.p1  ORF type:complete len:104 (-),score=16.32 TRINITY_DN22500_c0_g1_i3:17-328(-)